MYRTQQFQGQPYAPQQYGYGTVTGYYPYQTTDMTGIFSSMMPMIMMIVMLAMIMPMMRGIAAPVRE